MSRFRRPGDIVVASIHWGGNWGYAIPRKHREFASGLIDNGQVDLIHGHSPHHPKGMEIYRHRLIIYGCGDFLNDYEGIRGHEEYRSDLGLMYFPHLEATTGRLLGMDLTVTRVRKLRVDLGTPSEAQWLADALSREGREMGTRLLPSSDCRLVPAASDLSEADRQ